ncbi:hypothetical protein VTL71DRAFT_2169 [Oculimacula yallundae]|uniref:Uncharacterized protein n=1 Tax=Oculimacula yallundae TaxID=86028 RepID=A0ABR4CAC3_9HELO
MESQNFGFTDFLNSENFGVEELQELEVSHLRTILDEPQVVSDLLSSRGAGANSSKLDPHNTPTGQFSRLHQVAIQHPPSSSNIPYYGAGVPTYTATLNAGFGPSRNLHLEDVYPELTQYNTSKSQKQLDDPSWEISPGQEIQSSSLNTGSELHNRDMIRTNVAPQQGYFEAPSTKTISNTPDSINNYGGDVVSNSSGTKRARPSSVAMKQDTYTQRFETQGSPRRKRLRSDPSQVDAATVETMGLSPRLLEMFGIPLEDPPTFTGAAKVANGNEWLDDRLAGQEAVGVHGATGVSFDYGLSYTMNSSAMNEPVFSVPRTDARGQNIRIPEDDRGFTHSPVSILAPTYSTRSGRHHLQPSPNQLSPSTLNYNTLVGMSESWMSTTAPGESLNQPQTSGAFDDQVESQVHQNSTSRDFLHEGSVAGIVASDQVQITVPIGQISLPILQDQQNPSQDTMSNDPDLQESYSVLAMYLKYPGLPAQTKNPYSPHPQSDNRVPPGVFEVPYDFGGENTVGDGACIKYPCGDPSRVSRKGFKDSKSKVKYTNEMLEANIVCRRHCVYFGEDGELYRAPSILDGYSTTGQQ